MHKSVCFWYKIRHLCHLFSIQYSLSRKYVTNAHNTENSMASKITVQVSASTPSAVTTAKNSLGLSFDYYILTEKYSKGLECVIKALLG